MNSLYIALTEEQISVIKNHFFVGNDGKERVAFLLFGKSTAEDLCRQEQSTTYHLANIKTLNDIEISSSSSSHVTWENEKLFPFLKEASETGKIVGIVHSHINHPARFSSVDDTGEQGLLELIQNRNGKSSELVSIVIGTDGSMSIRLWKENNEVSEINKYRIIGKQFTYSVGRKNNAIVDGVMDRQALALGDSLNRLLHNLRVTVVGCGGTGSAVAMLLARLGVGKINLIDPDIVEKSNLNRLHGATILDAENKRKKVDVVRDNIQKMGLGTSTCAYGVAVNEPDCQNVLKSSDLIFGCTDDNVGRLLLNRFAYFYYIPVIDMGLAVEVSNDVPPRMLALDGRVTVLMPGTTCLICRGIINPERARAEYLKRNNEQEYIRLKEEAYVLGEQNPNPSIVTFTTEVASMAVNEMLHRIQGYRGESIDVPQLTRLFHRMHDLKPGDRPKDDCPVCNDKYYWGLGDVEPFLDQIW